MTIATTAERNSLATKYGQDAALAALYTSVPSGGSAGTEVSGGTYARQSLSWSAPINGVITVTVSFAVPAGTTIQGAGVLNSGGTFLDGGAVSSPVTFSVAGTYTLTLNYTQV